MFEKFTINSFDVCNLVCNCVLPAHCQSNFKCPLEGHRANCKMLSVVANSFYQLQFIGNCL